MVKLIKGIQIKSGKTVEGEYKFIHCAFNNLEIRSDYDTDSVLENDILEKIIPGNMGSFIYPSDAILRFKDNKVINKSILKSLMKDGKLAEKIYDSHNLVFDVPTNKDLQEEDDEEEEGDVEEENESDNEDNFADVEDEWDGEEDDVSDENEDNTGEY